MAAWTRGRNADDAAALLQAAGVSAMPVEGPLEHIADPHLAARGAFVTIDHPAVGPVRHVANPIRASRMPVRSAAPPPALGAHTADVLTRVLGLDAAEVARLVAEGVCR